MGVTFVDRKANRPNRYKVVPDSGNEYFVTLERADEPTELGTPINAATLNQLYSDNNKPTPEAIGAAPALTAKMTLEYASKHPAPNDLLNIMLNGDYTVDNMQPGYIATENATTLVNSPITSGAFYGIRTVEVFPVGHTTVRITETYPINGRVWSNMYSVSYQKWMGWVANFEGPIPDSVIVYSDDELKSWLDGLLHNMVNGAERSIRFQHGASQIVNGVQGMGGQGVLYGTLYKHSPDHAILKVSSYLGANFQLTKSGSWGEVAWINPTCAIGAEYCTTEKWHNSTVYTKVIDCGKPSDGATIAAPAGATRILRHESFFGPYLMPIGEKGETNYAYTVMTIPDLGVKIRRAGVGNYTWYEQMWYVK